MAKEKKKNETDQDIREMSFEVALEELKQIVSRLESGEGRLDEAIETYSRGAKLKRHCEEKLREAQAKIERITLDPAGNVATEPFDAG